MGASLITPCRKGNGYDVKALRAIVRMRKQDANERAEQETILETYMHALGMLADLPLGQAALKQGRRPGRPRGGDCSLVMDAPRRSIARSAARSTIRSSASL
jgi:hypothetical protein